MSERAKAIVRFIAGFIVFVGTAVSASVQASPEKSLHVFVKDPVVFLLTVIAVGAYLERALAPSVQQASKMDEHIEAKAEEKARTMVGNLILPPPPGT